MLIDFKDVVSGALKPKLIGMMGLPRSGKSTFCHQYLKPLGYVIVNPDSYRLALHGRPYIKNAEPTIWAAITLTVDALLMTDQYVVIDATNITPEAREPWEKRGAEFIHIDTSVHVCLLRAADNLELCNVITRMNLVQKEWMPWINTK